MSEVLDCIVIGAGPAGMACAGSLASRGLRVLVLEKNAQVGRKLVLSGSGRCNILCSEEDPDELARCFTCLPPGLSGDDKVRLPLHPPQVRSLFRSWPRLKLARFLESAEGPGISIVLDGAKYFPESDSARQVKTALQTWSEARGAIYRLGLPVKDLSRDESTWKVSGADWSVFHARKIVLASGGASWPQTGSTGDAARLSLGLGHPVLPWLPALGALEIQAFMFAGKPDRRLLTNCPGQALECKVEFSPGPAWPKGLVMEGGQGNLLFTHQGLSGPVVLELSGRIAWLMGQDIPVTLSLDLLPNLGMGDLETLVEEKRIFSPRSGFSQVFSGLLASRLVKEVMEGLGIDPSVPLSRLQKKDRLEFLDTLKGLKAVVKRVESLESSMQSTGGIAVQDLSWPSMEVKAQPGLHVIGDAVSLDRPSGGYSLSFCWASALAAAEAVGKSLQA